MSISSGYQGVVRSSNSSKAGDIARTSTIHVGIGVPLINQEPLGEFLADALQRATDVPLGVPVQPVQHVERPVTVDVQVQHRELLPAAGIGAGPLTLQRIPQIG